MDINKDNVIFNFKIGVIKELHNKQLITQKQMQDTINLINIEYRKEIMGKEQKT